MEAIQRLRRRAQLAVRLVSTPQAIVQTAPEQITIEAPSPEIVYVPVCDPSIVYGGWPYADYPPYSFGDFFSGASAGGFGCGWGQLADRFAALGLGRLGFSRPLHPHFSRPVRPHRQESQSADRRRGVAATTPFIGATSPIATRNLPPDMGARHRPNREILRAFHDYPTGSLPRIDGPVARRPTVMEQGPSLEGIDPDRGAFVPRAFEPFHGGAGVGVLGAGNSLQWHVGAA